MQRLPHALYSSLQVREMDRLAIEEYGVPAIDLMERAGAAALALLRRRWPAPCHVGVACGVGNNGGDGYVVARLLHSAGVKVTLVQVGEAARIRGTAAVARARALDTGVEVIPLEGCEFEQFDLIVDALLGTGLAGGVEGVWRHAIEAVNRSGQPVLALDLPSGLDPDSGAVVDVAVHADATITFIAAKRGLVTGFGPALCGACFLDDLGVPPAVISRHEPVARTIAFRHLAPTLRQRPRTVHKGECGHVLVVGGDLGMSGAARLAAEAAARCGAGLVSVATRTDHAALLNSGRPELMVHGVDTAADLTPLLDRATVVVVGPGLGRQSWGRAMLGRVLDSRLPLVVDADGLNLLAEDPIWRRDWVLTPHPGEAARLLGERSGEIQGNRPLAIAELVGSYGGVCVLKGAGTLIADEITGLDICLDGNPGMASGGMGDILSGVIAALIAQGMSLPLAARFGVCLHGAAADRASAEGGERGLLASDLLPHLRRLLNP